jgi:hypothetical protein
LTKILKKKERLFIILFLVTFQTAAIFSISIVDGSEIILLVFSLILLIEIFRGREQYYFVKTPLNLLNGIFLFFIILSAINGISPRGFVVFLKSAVLFFLLVNFLYKRKLVITALKWFVIITTISAVIGVFQEIVYLYTGVPVVGFVSERQMELLFEPTSMGMALRVPAFMGSYKIFAVVLSFNLIIVINILLYSSTLLTTIREKCFLYFAVIFMFSALILTFSRDAFLGTCIALLMSVFLKWRSYVIHFIMILALLFVLGHFCGIFDSFYKGGVSFIQAKATEFGGDRIELDREGFEGFLHGPFFLIGIGTGKGGKYTSHVRRWPAHNAFILAADELGIFGLLVYLSFFIFAIFRLITINLLAKESRDKGICRGLLFGFIAYCIILQFHAGYIEVPLWLYLGIIESMALILLERHRAPMLSAETTL